MKKKSDLGSIAFLSALILTVLLGFAAISTDMALLYAEKSNLQNAVDASALAGAQELPDEPEQAISTALQYGAENGVTVTIAEVTSDNKEILVSTEKNTSLFLARVLGIDSQIVTASARAAVLPAHTLVGAAPLSITMQDFVYGEEYNLKSGAQDGEHGWYGPLRLDGNGANVYRNALAEGCDVPLTIGQIVEVEHGNMSGPTAQGLEMRLNSDTRIPRNTFADHDRDAPQIIYIPVVEVVSRNGQSIHEVCILGFAAFFVESVSGNGNDSIINGRFLKTIVSAGKEQSFLSTLIHPEEDISTIHNADFGLFATKLLMN